MKTTLCLCLLAVTCRAADLHPSLEDTNIIHVKILDSRGRDWHDYGDPTITNEPGQLRPADQLRLGGTNAFPLLSTGYFTNNTYATPVLTAIQATISFETVTNITAFIITNAAFQPTPALRTTVKRQTWIQFVAVQTPFKALLKEETVSDWISQWEEKKTP